jgi:hypothetical protein
LKTPAVAVAVLGIAIAAGGGESKASPAFGKFVRIATVNGTTAAAVAMARNDAGGLALVYQTYNGRTLSGLGSTTISPNGDVGAQVQALAGWQAGMPGLVAMPSHKLEAFFGAVSPGNVSSVWSIDGGKSGNAWAAPADVRGGGPNEQLAYGSDVSAALAGSTPVLALPQAGNLVVQKGLGNGAPSYRITDGTDGSTTDADFAVDAATGGVVASWSSIAHEPSLYMQGVAPSVGKAVHVPGQSRNALVIAGRDHGPGVFGAYTTDGTHVRLYRYGGGSVAVGSQPGTQAKVLGVATGVQGRIWVMWGDDSGGGVAVTRSNKAVTKFEPIQHIKLNLFDLWRIQGDGEGQNPLDLFLDGIPSTKGTPQAPGLYYARVLPVLTVSTSLAKLTKTHVLTVHVTDAGDPVSANVSVKGGQTAKTNAQGVAKLTFGTGGGTAAITVVASLYRPATTTVGI